MVKKLMMIISLLTLVYCGSVATVRPLPRGERALAFSVGGPVSEIPGYGTFPMPYSVVRYRVGVAERLEGHLGLHTTNLVFGLITLDAGLSYGLIKQKGVIPYVCVGANPTMWVNPFYDGAGFTPQAEIVASWAISEKYLVYTGMQAFFQLEKPYVPFAPLIGGELRVGNHVGLTAEVKWYAPAQSSERTVEYPLDPGNQGGLGAVLGVTLYPGGLNE